MISFLICKSQFLNFLDAYQELDNIIQTSTLEEIIELFEVYSLELNTYFILTLVPSFILSYICFVIFITSASYIVYLKIDLRIASPQYAKVLFSMFKNNKRNKLFLYTWGLNFPLLILIVLGGVAGCFFALNFSNSISFVCCLSLCGSCLLSCFFLPFYFSNLESIYLCFKKDILLMEDDFLTRIKKQSGSLINEIKKMEENILENEKDDSSENQSS